MCLLKQVVFAYKRLALVALFLTLIGCTPQTQEPLVTVSDIFNQSLPTTEATLLYSEKIDRGGDKELPFYMNWGLIGTNLSDSDFIAQHKDLMIKQGWKILSYTVSGYPIYCKPSYDHVLVRMINGLAFNELNVPSQILAQAKENYQAFFRLDVTYYPLTSYNNICN